MRWNAGLAALAAAWGLVAVLAGAVDVDAGPLAFLRLTLAAVTLAAVALLTGRIHLLVPGRHLWALVALGVVQAAHWWLFFEAVKRGSVALAVLTFYTAPLFLAVLRRCSCRSGSPTSPSGRSYPAGSASRWSRSRARTGARSAGPPSPAGSGRR